MPAEISKSTGLRFTRIIVATHTYTHTKNLECLSNNKYLNFKTFFFLARMYRPTLLKLFSSTTIISFTTLSFRLLANFINRYSVLVYLFFNYSTNLDLNGYDRLYRIQFEEDCTDETKEFMETSPCRMSSGDNIRAVSRLDVHCRSKHHVAVVHVSFKCCERRDSYVTDT